MDSTISKMRSIRRKRRLRLSDVARGTGYSAPFLCMLELGARQGRLTVWRDLARFYRVKLDDLVETKKTRVA